MSFLNSLEQLIGIAHGNPQQQAKVNIQADPASGENLQVAGGINNLQPAAGGHLGGGQISVPGHTPVSALPPHIQALIGQHMQQPAFSQAQVGQLNSGTPLLQAYPQDGSTLSVQGQQNPGYIPMQSGNVNYQQAPQPATFNPLQGSQNGMQGGIRF